MTIHAHFDTYAVDCDGPISRSYVMTMNDDELAEAGKAVNDFSEIHFINRVVANVVNAYSILDEGRLTVRRLGDDDVRLTWQEQTDEGSRSADVTLCHDECDEAETSYRDHRAESMNY